MVALNVGLSDGIIHQRLFTILVLMALVTTLTLIKPSRAHLPAGESLPAAGPPAGVSGS